MSFEVLGIRKGVSKKSGKPYLAIFYKSPLYGDTSETVGDEGRAQFFMGDLSVFEPVQPGEWVEWVYGCNDYGQPAIVGYNVVA